MFMYLLFFSVPSLPLFLSHLTLCFLSYIEDGLTLLSGLLCGIASGVIAATVTQPFDVLKTRMQLSPASSRTLWSTAGDIVHIGLREMFRGLVPRIARRTLMATFTWAFYEQVTTIL